VSPRFSRTPVAPQASAESRQLQEIATELAAIVATHEGSREIFTLLSSVSDSYDHTFRASAAANTIGLSRAPQTTTDDVGRLIAMMSAASSRPKREMVLVMPLAEHRRRWSAGQPAAVVFVDPATSSGFLVNSSGAQSAVSSDTPPDIPALVLRFDDEVDLAASADAGPTLAPCSADPRGTLGSLCVQQENRLGPVAGSMNDGCGNQFAISFICDDGGGGWTPPPPPIAPAPGVYVREVVLNQANISCGWFCSSSSWFNVYTETPNVSGDWAIFACTGRGAAFNPNAPRRYYADMWGNRYTSPMGSSLGMILSADDITLANSFYQEDVNKFRFEIWSDEFVGHRIPDCNVQPNKPEAPEKTAKNLESIGKAFYNAKKVITTIGKKKIAVAVPIIGLAIFALNVPRPSYSRDDLYGDLVLENPTRTPTTFGYMLTYKIKSKYFQISRGNWIELGTSIDNGFVRVEVVEEQ
jgi:hypothetical protein